ncbi:MAG: TetR/AcrR family transcriptional regulator [Tissierellia bacterium]|nr:TetR/AcrR family transcriptional regulator [Tissierellia bacterium]
MEKGTGDKMNKDKHKSFEKREELINIAMKEFGEKGYENASLNNILKETGISKGTFYYHYKNKEDLYMHLLDIITEEKLKFMSKEMNALGPSQSVFDKFKILIKAGMKFANTNPTIDKFAQGFIKEIGTKAYEERMKKYFLSRREFLQSLLQKYGFKSMDYIGDLIEEGYGKGEIRQDLPKDFVKRLVNHTFTNLRVISAAENLEEYEQAANYLVNILKDGIGRR